MPKAPKPTSGPKIGTKVITPPHGGKIPFPKGSAMNK
jgi:hypothetical protein